MEKPIVSIITPMYNGEKYVAEMIESVINQTFKNWELVIVDDCSTDNSCKIVEDFMKKDPRIRLLRQQKNKGPAEARKLSIQSSRGKYIAFLDCDDFWKRNKLEIQIGYMEEKHINVTCTSYTLASENLEQEYKIFRVPKIIRYNNMLAQNYFSCNTVAVNIEEIQNIDLISYDKHEDYLTWLRLIKHAGEAHGIMDSLATYRIRKSSRSSGKLKNITWMWNIYYNIEKLGLLPSALLTINYTIRGLIKYWNIPNK